MSLQVTSTNQAIINNGIKCLIYGLAGVGKTKLLATAPSPIIISAEKGLMTIRDHNIPAIEVEHLGEANQALDMILSDPNLAQHQTICLDSASDLAERTLITQKNAHKNKQQAYGVMADDIINFLYRLRDHTAGRNVIVLAKEAQFTNQVSQVTKHYPSLPGQVLPHAIPYIYDETWNISNDVTMQGTTSVERRVLITQASAQYDAKDRSGLLPAEIEIPTMPLGTQSNFLTNVFNTISQTAPTGQ